ncbi:HNH endonuclease [Streptomyces sp. NPDC004532]
MPKIPEDVDGRFDRSIVRPLETDCWIWTGAVINSGYGIFWLRGKKKITAHRYAFMRANSGVTPPVVRHACDVKLCVNPEHLTAGTNRDNSADMVSRRRMNGGGAWHLTAEQVAEIRRRFIPGDHGRGGNRRELAEEFGIGAKHIWRIATGRSGDYRLRRSAS